MGSLSQRFFQTVTRFSQVQGVVTIVLVAIVAIMATYLIIDGRRLTTEVQDFLDGDRFKVLGEVANLQREVLKAQVAVKNLRLEPDLEVDDFIQRYAFAKTTLRNLTARANDDGGDLSFTPRAIEIVQESNEITALIDVGRDELETAITPANRIDILVDIDKHFDKLELLVNELYVEQEALRVTFLFEAVDTVVSSRNVMAIASGTLLALSVGIIYTTQRTISVEREANERFQLASTAVSSAIYDWDVLQDNVVWSDGLQKVFGYQSEEISPDIAWLWECIHDEDAVETIQKFQDAQGDGESFSIEHRFKTKDGVYLDVSNRVQVVTDLRGQVYRMVGSIEDITEQKLIIAYQESNRAKTRLLAHVSHELKTPLSAIIGYTEMIQAGVHGGVNDAQSNALERVLANAKSLLDLINSLLTQTRVEDQEETVTMGLLSPSDLVDALYDSVGVLAESKGLMLTADVAHDMPNALIGDIGQLRQVITNLAGNAVKFTESGEVALNIYQSSNNYWSISVSDTGLGISKADQAKIFNAFSQVDETLNADQRGFGLGLSIVKQIVDNLDGELRVDSQLGKGSTFTVDLPLIKRMEML